VTSRQTSTWGSARCKYDAVAATFVATQEDSLIFNGNSELGHEGIFTASGRLTVPNNREKSGSACRRCQATGALAAAGHYGPYAIVVNPILSGIWWVYGNTGMLELDQSRR
jgi:uncharacterized linocin/CFP29 family protein